MTVRDILFAVIALAGVVLMCVALLSPGFDGATPQQCSVSLPAQ